MADNTTFQAAAYTAQGTTRDKVALPGELFDGTVNMPVMHQAVKAYLANQRQGNAATKIRKFVVGGNQKPWKQKGTGRARQGSTRAPHWTHGGITFGPKPRSYAYSLPAKARHASLRSALSAKAAEGGLVVIESFKVDGVKTKQVVSFLKGFKVYGSKVLVVVDAIDEKVKLSCRNVECLALGKADSLHPYQLLWAEKVFVT